MHNQAVVDSKDERWRWIYVLCWCSILDFFKDVSFLISVIFQGCFFFISVKVTSSGSCATKGG